MIITRYAPSTTSTSNHVGGLRTALFNYLFAKNNNGKFLLRFEDTDRERVFPEFIQSTLKELDCIGIKVDNTPFQQSTKFEHYKSLAYKLLEEGKAYKCYCSQEEVEARNKECNGYDGFCRNIKRDDNAPFVIRLKMPDNETLRFCDGILGEISFDLKNVARDPVLLKNDGITPSYTLASVIDDHEMDITHVLRGSEWVPSTPLSILTYRAFGWYPPIFCHLPVINGSDNKKLSKRHGAVSFNDLIKQGYLTEAIINYIAFLGWNPKTDQEIFSLEELEKTFDIKNINKAPAIFDYEKLNWFNKQYLAKMDEDTFYRIVEGILPTCNDKRHLSNLVKSRITKVIDAIEQSGFINEIEYDINLFENKKLKLSTDKALAILEWFDVELNFCGGWIWKPEDLFNKLSDLVSTTEFKKNELLWVIRIALSGQPVTPGGATDLMYLLGQEETKKRIYNAAKVCG